jgi:hypothetical protein
MLIPPTVLRPAIASLVLLLAGCGSFGSQVIPTTQHKTLTLKPGDLERHGLAFLTPATVTGQEQDRESLALIFGESVHERLPKVRISTLPETLGAINRAGLADEYRRLLEHYRDTGIFRRDGLREIGAAVGVRYLAQLKMASFMRDLRERFSLFGLRLFQTQYANIRLDMQIWDSEDGVIAWEAIEELNYANDSSVERPVTFRRMVQVAAQEIIEHLP